MLSWRSWLEPAIRPPSGICFPAIGGAARAAAFGVTGDFASAEDAAAEAFRFALTAIGSPQDPGRFAAWLRTIVIRKARREVRYRRGIQDASTGDTSGGNDRPDDAAQRLELAALLHHPVASLPKRLREAVMLVSSRGPRFTPVKLSSQIPCRFSCRAKG